MSKEILLVAETVCNEKGVPKEVIFKAIEEALEVASKKRSGRDINVRVAIDRKTGDYETFRQWHVVADDAEIENPEAEIYLEDALEQNDSLVVGDLIEEPIESVAFGRISAQSAKQIIIQKVREAERAQVAQAYQEKIGKLISGLVKKVTRDYVIMDLGANAEGFILKEEMLPSDKVRMGDRIRAYLYKVDPENRGPQIYLSRTHKGMLVELFRIEVPEIGEEVIQIKAAARDPGLRAKIAVKTNDGRIDPVGACVGMRGSRVQTVSNELGGERVDIILWDENPVKLVINAMAPAEVASIMVDEDTHSMDIAVAEKQLAQAIGRNGQNINLASQLSGWTLNVMSEEQAAQKSDAEAESFVKLFVNELKVDEETAVILVEEGFSTIEEIAYLSTEELDSVEGIDAEYIGVLKNKAKDWLLIKAIAKEEALSRHPEKDLLEMEGMDFETAHALAKKGIVSREDLAEQSIDELLEIEGFDEKRAATLIMTARKIWFEDEK